LRKIDHIVLHCTAGPQNQPTRELFARWAKNGWTKPGYHFVIESNGDFTRLVEDDQIANGVAGFNKNSIHICYKGGWEDGKPVDNRTEQQKKAMLTLVRTMLSRYPKAKVRGHRDFSPDKDGDGVIEKPEWIKACPCFDVKTWCLSNGIPKSNIFGA